MSELDRVRGKSFDEMIEEMCRPRWWIHEQWIRLRRFIINQVYYLEWLDYIVGFINRGKRGWSRRDIWNLDLYLARIIADTVEELGKSSNRSEDVPYETIVEAYRQYIDVWEDEKFWGDTEKVESLKSRMSLFNTHFMSLWD